MVWVDVCIVLEIDLSCGSCELKSSDISARNDFQEHKIAEEAIQRLLMGAASSSTLPDSTSDNKWVVNSLFFFAEALPVSAELARAAVFHYRYARR